MERRLPGTYISPRPTGRPAGAYPEDWGLMKILVVDDSPSMRSFIGGALESAFGAEITESGNGFEALKTLPGQRFDAIIADVNMPDINGLELLRYLKQHPAYRHIPVVIVSTEVDDTDRERGLSAGAAAYVTKPFEPEELEDVLRPLVSVTD
jgi:two-component system chemotaxis response regulator CheY